MELNLVTCHPCRGRGDSAERIGRKGPNDPESDVQWVTCEVCNGDGEVESFAILERPDGIWLEFRSSERETVKVRVEDAARKVLRGEREPSLLQWCQENRRG